MNEWKVPVQSLIDHIKSAVDVDQWAKDMAEELLKEQEAVVRCKDCIYLNADTGICIVGIPHGHKDTFYCSYGRRR